MLLYFWPGMGTKISTGDAHCLENVEFISWKRQLGCLHYGAALLLAESPMIEPFQSSCSNESQGSRAHDQQHCPEVRSGRQGDPNSSRQGYVRCHAYWTLGKQRQRHTRNDPASDLPATAQPRRESTSFVAGSRLDLAAMVNVQACDSDAPQPQLVEDGDAVSGQ
jgi:hypothetical protein